MSQNKDIIFKLRGLIELRQNTIIANKRQMKDYLIEYKKSLELEKELKREQNLLNNAISLLQYGLALEKEQNEKLQTSENIAINRDEQIYTDDEE